MTISTEPVQQFHPRDNVVPFPRASVRRATAVAAALERRSPRHRRALGGAELNARLLVLLGCCLASAALLLSSVRFLQG